MSHDYEKMANMLKMAAVFSDLMDGMTPRHSMHVGILDTPIVTNRQARADLENMARRKVEEFNRSLGMDDDAVCTDDTCKKCSGQCKGDTEPDIEGYDSMSDFMKNVYDILFPDVAERIKKAKANASAKTEAVKTPDIHEPVGETYDDYEDDYLDDDYDDEYDHYNDEYLDDEDDGYFEDDDDCDCDCSNDVEGEDSPICDGDCALCMAQRALEKADEIHSELDTIYEDIQGMRNDISEVKGMLAELLKKTSETPKTVETLKTVETKAEDDEPPKPKKPRAPRKTKAKAEEVKPKTAEDELKDKVAEVAKTKIPKKPRTKKSTE